MRAFKKAVLKGVVLPLFFFVVAGSFFSIAYAQPAGSSITDKVKENLINAGKSAGVDPGSEEERKVTFFLARMVSEILVVAGVVFFVIIVIGGIMWMTAGGREDQVEKGKSLLKNAIIGFVITVTAYLIVRFVEAIVFKAANPFFRQML